MNAESLLRAEIKRLQRALDALTGTKATRKRGPGPVAAAALGKKRGRKPKGEEPVVE